MWKPHVCNCLSVLPFTLKMNKEVLKDYCSFTNFKPVKIVQVVNKFFHFLSSEARGVVFQQRNNNILSLAWFNLKDIKPWKSLQNHFNARERNTNLEFLLESFQNFLTSFFGANGCSGSSSPTNRHCLPMPSFSHCLETIHSLGIFYTVVYPFSDFVLAIGLFI
jgi:hypothetical protein